MADARPFFEGFTPTSFMRAWALRRLTGRLHHIKNTATNVIPNLQTQYWAKFVIDYITSSPNLASTPAFMGDMRRAVTGSHNVWPDPPDARRELELGISESREIVNHAGRITLARELADEAAQHISDLVVTGGVVGVAGLRLVQAALVAEMVPPRLLMGEIMRRRQAGLPWTEGYVSMDERTGLTYMATPDDIDDAARAFRVLYFATQLFAMRIAQRSQEAHAYYTAPLTASSDYWSECRAERLDGYAARFDHGGPLHLVSSVIMGSVAEDMARRLHDAVIPEHTMAWYDLLCRSLRAPTRSQLAQVARDMTVVFPPVMWQTIFVMAGGNADHLLAEQNLGVVHVNTQFSLQESRPRLLLPHAAGTDLMLLESQKMFSGGGV